MKTTLFRMFVAFSIILMSLLYAQALTVSKKPNFQQISKVSPLLINNKLSKFHSEIQAENDRKILEANRKILADYMKEQTLRKLSINDISSSYHLRKNGLHSLPTSYARQRAIGIGIEKFGLSVTFWKEKCYVSPSLGWSAKDITISYFEGVTAEPDTGFFLNGSAGNLGKNVSANYYTNSGFSTQKGYSTPNVGVLAGYTFEVCSAFSKYLRDK